LLSGDCVRAEADLQQAAEAAGDGEVGRMPLPRLRESSHEVHVESVAGLVWDRRRAEEAGCAPLLGLVPLTGVAGGDIGLHLSLETCPIHVGAQFVIRGARSWMSGGGGVVAFDQEVQTEALVVGNDESGAAVEEAVAGLQLSFRGVLLRRGG
jgi:hypothetical protein